MTESPLHPEYRTFLRLLRLLAYYSPEYYYQLPKNLPIGAYEDDEYWALAHLDDLHLISLDEYLENFYQPRRLEATLEKEFAIGPGLIYLIGWVGSGKTSLALAMRRRLEENTLHSVYVAYIDVRYALSGRDQTTLAATDLREFLRRLVMNSYLQDLFPYEGTATAPRNQKISLWAYLLDRHAHRDRAPEITREITSLQDKAANLLAGYNRTKSRLNQPHDYYSWLVDQAPVDPRVLQLIDQLELQLDLKHLVSAARHLHRRTRQVIWFDNVDSLDHRQQEAIHEHVVDFQTNVANLATIVIALRDENVRYFTLREHDHPTVGRRFLIEAPSKGDFFSYPAHLLPPPSEETIRAAVRKRLEATRRFQSRKVGELYRLLDRLHENPECPEQQIADVEREISYYEPLISQEAFSHLATLSARATEALILEKAAYLANNSLRDFFRIHRDFLGDLLKQNLDASLPPVALTYQQWYLATLFLYWMRSTERSYKITLHDIFEHFRDWSKPGGQLVGCFLPYLIINTLWNLENEKNGGGGRRAYPTLGELYQRLKMLGYANGDIRYYLEGQIQRSIIMLREPSSQLTDHNLDTELYVTYCGKCLTGVTYNSFGYIYECLEHLNLGGSTDSVARLPAEPRSRQQIADTEQAILALLPHLCDIAKMHAMEFERIRESGYLGTVGWLGKYRALFAIPNEPEFRRQEIGAYHRGRRKALQLEAILTGVLSYAKNLPVRKRVTELLGLYIRTVEALGAFKTPEVPEFNFRLALGFSDDFQRTED